MTGHIDDGSDTGACGKGGCGFRTTYLGWIDCPECLVLVDWGLETGLFVGDKDGIVQPQSEAEIAAELAAENARREEEEAERREEDRFWGRHAEDDDHDYDDDYNTGY
jgi:hypothetical protein